MPARTEVDVANMALRRLGDGVALVDPGDGLLASIVNPSPVALACAFWLPKKLLWMSEDFPWTWARKNALLVLADDLSTDAWGSEWTLAYTYPADCARAWRFLGDQGSFTGGYWGGTDWVPVGWAGLGGRFNFRVVDLADAKIILANIDELDAYLEYTRNDVAVATLSEQMASALAWGLAAEVGREFTGWEERSQAAVEYHVRELAVAKASNMNEESEPPPQGGVLLRARGGY